MFNFFKKKQPVVISRKRMPIPVTADYILDERQERVLNNMIVDANGFVKLVDVSKGIFRQEISSIIMCLDGKGDTFLGGGLTYDISFKSSNDYIILKSDVTTFIARVRAYRRRNHIPTK